MNRSRDVFVELCAELTGFDAAELEATGMVSTYSSLLIELVGDQIVGELLQAATVNDVDVVLRHSCFGPLCRNIIVLWYLGQWDQLPAEWRNAHGAHPGDATHIVSALAYTEGLVWPTMGSHPPGAKQPGYGSWALPPGTGSYGWHHVSVTVSEAPS
jgi:hypothetical protein